MHFTNSIFAVTSLLVLSVVSSPVPPPMDGKKMPPPPSNSSMSMMPHPKSMMPHPSMTGSPPSPTDGPPSPPSPPSGGLPHLPIDGLPIDLPDLMMKRSDDEKRGEGHQGAKFLIKRTNGDHHEKRDDSRGSKGNGFKGKGNKKGGKGGGKGMKGGMGGMGGVRNETMGGEGKNGTWHKED